MSGENVTMHERGEHSAEISAEISATRRLIARLTAEPELLHAQELAFFKAFLLDFSCESDASTPRCRGSKEVLEREDRMSDGDDFIDVLVDDDALPGEDEATDSDSAVLVLGKVVREARRRQQKAASAREYRKREKFEQCSVELTINTLRKELSDLTGMTGGVRSTYQSYPPNPIVR